MANEIRVRQNFLGGLVDTADLASGGTTLQSAGLAGITTTIDTSNHLPIVLDPDGIYGAPEIAYITAYTLGATSATLLRGQEGTTARQHLLDTPWVHAPTVTDFRSLLLARVVYDPATTTSYTVTSTTPVDVDATNLAITFTAPLSGKVKVRLHGVCSTSSTSASEFWTLREGTTQVGIRQYAVQQVGAMMAHAEIYLSGLTAGSHTYKWAWFVNGAVTGNLYAGGPSTGGYPAVLEVYEDI